MKKIKLLSILAATVFAANVSAFTYITGDGTDEDHPYFIGSTEAWNELCAAVQGGHSFSGEYLKQTADITISERMAVHHDAPQFCGEYDGAGHIMTLAIGEHNEAECAAPFGVINTATIKNLHIKGNIYTNYMRPASIAGFVNGNSTIKNCWSEVTICSERFGDVDAGAFVARVNSNHIVNIEGCLFTGQILYNYVTEGNKGGYEGGGFVGWTQDDAIANISYSVFAPTMIQNDKNKDKFYTFVGGKERGSLSNCYYNTVANDEISKKEGTRAYWVRGVNGVEVQYFNNYYPPLESYDVSGIEIYEYGIMAGGAVYGASGSTVPVSFRNQERDGVYFEANGTRVTSSHDFTMNQDYTIEHAVAQVHDPNDYPKDHYYMTFSEALANWDDGATLILWRNIEHGDEIWYTNGIRTLDLNGRGIKYTGVTSSVIGVTGSFMLTINDSKPYIEHKFSVDGDNFATLDEAHGTLKIKGGYITGGKGNPAKFDYREKNGGGIYVNRGTVTMNGGTVIGNNANRHAGGVFVANGGHFTLNSGAAIMHNKAKYGGGLSVNGNSNEVDNTVSAEATINGGVIANNFAPDEAGGIHTNTRDLPVSVTIKGASEVTGNKSDGNGGGVLMAANATITLSGNPSIQDNYKGSTKQNVYIPSGKKLTIDNAGISGANVGVTMATPGTFTTGLNGHGDETNFFSDDATYAVSLDADAEAQLVVPVEITAKQDPLHAGDYYTTIFYSNQAFKLPAGVEAYVATIEGDKMHMNKVVNAGEVLPMNKAFILKSNAGGITLLPYGVGAVDVTADNCLLGVDDETDIHPLVPNDKTCYVISGGSKDGTIVGVGFYQYQAPNKLKAHKAYTYLPDAPAGAPKRLRFVFEEEQTATAIDNASTESKGCKYIENGMLIIERNGVRYNAQGQIVR